MPARDVEAYLAKLSGDKRATLEKVRRAIRVAAPDAEEGMSYGMPAFIQGKPIAGYSASAKRSSYFPMSGSITSTLAADLAAALWHTGIHDARMLATMIDDPRRVTPAQMDRWARNFDNWALVDTACFTLFDRTPHAFEQIEKWAKAKDELVKRAAFALLASRALHGFGSEKDHLRGLVLIEREASDPRNFVKKGASWGLRAIGGKKNPKLRAAARALAKKLSESDDPAERWTGKEALRAFAKS